MASVCMRKKGYGLLSDINFSSEVQKSAFCARLSSVQPGGQNDLWYSASDFIICQIILKMSGHENLMTDRTC